MNVGIVELTTIMIHSLLLSTNEVLKRYGFDFCFYSVIKIVICSFVTEFTELFKNKEKMLKFYNLKWCEQIYTALLEFCLNTKNVIVVFQHMLTCIMFFWGVNEKP